MNSVRANRPPVANMLILSLDCSSVYLHADGSTSKFEIVRAVRGHFTAGMAWGAHASSNLLFASSASLDDGTGHHKAFDVAHNKMVVEFDAKKEACSTLALDPSGKCPPSTSHTARPLPNALKTHTGERLFIATEGPETTYNLRQFDVRARLRKPVQTVALEPFADLTDKAAIDINSLALSADGLYLAAGRTDNWVDVYDARVDVCRCSEYIFGARARRRLSWDDTQRLGSRVQSTRRSVCETRHSNARVQIAGRR